MIERRIIQRRSLTRTDRRKGAADRRKRAKLVFGIKRKDRRKGLVPSRRVGKRWVGSSDRRTGKKEA